MLHDTVVLHSANKNPPEVVGLPLQVLQTPSVLQVLVDLATLRTSSWRVEPGLVAASGSRFKDRLGVARGLAPPVAWWLMKTIFQLLAHWRPWRSARHVSFRLLCPRRGASLSQVPLHSWIVAWSPCCSNRQHDLTSRYPGARLEGVTHP